MKSWLNKYDDNIHYSTKWAINNDWDYLFVFGGRNNGKTTGWEMQMIDDFFNNGYVYGKVVRKYTYDEEFAKSWFDTFAQQYLRKEYNHEIIIDGYNYYLLSLDEKERYLPLENGQRKARYNLKLFCTTINVAYENDFKSHDLKFINRLIFEEFTLIDDYGYIENEFEHFNSLVSTINRDRQDLKVIFIGNTIKKHNPYFEGFEIDLKKLKLKPGDKKILQNKNYENGAIFAIEFVKSVFKKDDEVPRILRFGGNDIAITGDFISSPYIVEKEFDEFLNKQCDLLSKNFVIKTNNKNYFHLTYKYKKCEFNLITSRFNGKSKGITFDYDLSIIENIKSGNITIKDIIEILSIDNIYNNDTLYSDDDIEYKFNRLLKVIKY